MTTMTRRPLVRRVAGVAVGVVVALLAVEFGFRLVLTLGIVKADIWPMVDVDFERTIFRYAEDPLLVYECRPGASTVTDGIPIRVNSAGFRGADFPLERRPGVRRVAVVGDSVTFGAAVPEDHTFVARAGAALGDRWEAFNFGVTGYNSDQERIELDSRVLPYRPDVVAVAYCMNDITPTDGIAEMSIASHPSSWGRRLHSQLVIYLSDQAARRSSWRNRSFDRPARLFSRLSELQGEGGTRGLVVLFPQFDEARTSWNRPEEYDKARDLATASGVAIVDLRQALESVPPSERPKLFIDRTHLSESGHALVARLLADAVRRLVPN